MKDQVYIERIIKYSERIVTYLYAIHSFDEFALIDEKVDAVILNLEQIGETAKKLSKEIKNHFNQINWPSIIGLRNMISHEYEGVKLTIIYEIAKKSIPSLLMKIREKQQTPY